MLWRMQPGIVSGRGALDGAGTAPPVANLIGWWDASVTASLNLTGSSINSVADQSGLGNTMNWANVKPTYNATGFNTTKPAMVFGSSSSLIASSFPMGTGNTLTAWYVGTLGAASGTNPRALNYVAPSGADWNRTNSWGIYRNSATQSTIMRNSVSAVGTSTADPSPHRCIYTINSSGVMTVYIDGVAGTPATSAGTWVSAGTAQIGREAAGGAYWTGPIAEAGISTAFSDATAVAALDTQLKTKWGLGGSYLGYATWDAATALAVTLSGNNLIATNTGTSDGGARLEAALCRNASGSFKLYWEVQFTTLTGGNNVGVGVGDLGASANHGGMTTNAFNGTVIYRGGTIWVHGSSTGTSLGARASGDWIGIAMDLANSKIWYKKVSGTPGNWNNSGTADPATNTGGLAIPTARTQWVPWATFGGTGAAINNVTTLNSGASAFVGAVPSGFTAGWSA